MPDLVDFEDDVERLKFVTTFLSHNRRKRPDICAYMQAVESMLVELRIAAGVRPKSNRRRYKRLYMQVFMRKKRARLKQEALILKEMGH